MKEITALYNNSLRFVEENDKKKTYMGLERTDTQRCGETEAQEGVLESETQGQKGATRESVKRDDLLETHFQLYCSLVNEESWFW